MRLNRSSLAIALCVLSLFGLGVSIYLTIEHYTGNSSLSCPLGGGAINCLKVTTSQWSVIVGVPVAVLGLGFFVAMTLVCLPIELTAPLHLARIGLAGIGMVMVFYLIYIELFKVDAICLWCTSVHVVTVVLLVLSLLYQERSTRFAGRSSA